MPPERATSRSLALGAGAFRKSRRPSRSLGEELRATGSVGPSGSRPRERSETDSLTTPTPIGPAGSFGPAPATAWFRPIWLRDVDAALSHPLSPAYLRALTVRRELSPSEFARESDEPRGNVSYHLKALREVGRARGGLPGAVTRGDGTSLFLHRPAGGDRDGLMDLLAAAWAGGDQSPGGWLGMKPSVSWGP